MSIICPLPGFASALHSVISDRKEAHGATKVGVHVIFQQMFLAQAYPQELAKSLAVGIYH